MTNLYIDFDGVILDTIKVTYQIFKEKNITSDAEIAKFYKDLDWEKLLNETPVINDSINAIKRIIATGEFNVKILTHVYSQEEGRIKQGYIAKYIKDLEVIPVAKGTEKCDVVDPINSILIDDYLNNLDLWYQKGGIPIKFSDTNKKSRYITIKKLDEVTSLFPNKVKSR